MRKVVIFVLKIFAFFAALYGYSQQPSLSVQSFEYIWEKADGTSLVPDKSRVIFASEDSAKKAIKNAFAVAIQKRWGVEMHETSLSVKPLKIFSIVPKFKTTLKEKQAGAWYLFLQIFDRRTGSFAENAVSTLEIKCRLIDGSSDSMILDRDLSVDIYQQPSPQDQVLLSRLSGYPSDFIRAFDSIANWLFQPENPGQKIIRIRPACIFTGSAPSAGSISRLLFNSDNTGIHHLTQPSFLFKTPGPTHKKADAMHNRAGNTAGGALTLITGVSFNKSKVFEYMADLPFEETDSVFHCSIHYTETETAERGREKTTNTDGSKSYSVKSGDYTLSERRVDSASINTITIGNDTLATFQIMSISKSIDRTKYTRYWDGNDSATIAPMPKNWNNASEEHNVILSGQMNNHSFSMKTTKGINVKEFYIDGRMVMIMYGKNAPAKALLFQPVSVRQLKMFTMLASLPYRHFNYSAY